jgi:hypothetical protein
VFSPALASAQEPAAEPEEPEEPEGVDWLVFPTFKYNDDAGFQYGAQLAVIEHARGVRPHVWDMRLRVEHSTRNRHSHRLIMDAPHLLPGSLRLFMQVDILNIDDANYFGLGSDAPNTSNEPYHKFRLTEPRGRVLVQRRLEEVFLLGGGVEYHHTWVGAQRGSLLRQEQPLGWDGSRDLIGILSLAFDNRRSQIIPRDSYVGELYLKGSSASLGSQFDFLVLGTTHQGYWSPWPWLVLAQRVMLEQQSGDVPLSELYRLGGTVSFRGVGGSLSHRGFVEGRFLGRRRALSNSEIRYYFPRAWDHLLIGLGAFMDASRVSGGDEGFFQGVHTSGGGEVVIGWKESFIFRMDYAISNEDSLFYITGRHMF